MICIRNDLKEEFEFILEETQHCIKEIGYGKLGKWHFFEIIFVSLAELRLPSEEGKEIKTISIRY